MDKPWGTNLDADEPTIPSGQPVGWPRKAHDGLPASPIEPGHITVLWQEMRNAIIRLDGVLRQTETDSLANVLRYRVMEHGQFSQAVWVGYLDESDPNGNGTRIELRLVDDVLKAYMATDQLFARVGLYIGATPETAVEVISAARDGAFRNLGTTGNAVIGGSVLPVDVRLAHGGNKPINSITGGVGTAAGAQATLTEANTYAEAGDKVFATIEGNVTAGELPFVQGCYATDGNVFVDIVNLGAAPLANNVTVNYRIEKPAP